MSVPAGPDVPMQTPMAPELARVKPSAICEAPSTWRASTWPIVLRGLSAAYRGLMAAPGTPKAWVTPSFSITRTAAAAAVIRAMGASLQFKSPRAESRSPPARRTARDRQWLDLGLYALARRRARVRGGTSPAQISTIREGIVATRRDLASGMATRRPPVKPPLDDRNHVMRPKRRGGNIDGDFLLSARDSRSGHCAVRPTG